MRTKEMGKLITQENHNDKQNIPEKKQKQKVKRTSESCEVYIGKNGKTLLSFVDPPREGDIIKIDKSDIFWTDSLDILLSLPGKSILVTKVGKTPSGEDYILLEEVE
ncbi:unnamed protein product [marine sediment metagenome]|uniref:Uncharacterized protein n=1 Tax=marine sediment metagenome TaxID=412755 RepID=X1CPL8_9ZZZZ